VTEFTGERVIPGQVNDDLWAEHMARYAFAARFASGCRALDAGSGTGYGANELADSAGWVVGVDVSAEAIEYAREYARAHSTHARSSFLRASAAALPFSKGAFGLVTAFEVIEHLASWRELLSEGRRVLAPGGLFLVSTPNRVYYADSRRLDGPNPYHVHEFEFEEFEAALREFFPHVAILFQNRVEAFAFHGHTHGQTGNPDIEVRLDTATDEPENAHFFIGVCSNAALPDLETFLYVPRAANVLREREQHIRLLDHELAQSKRWLDQSIADHHALQAAHEEQTRHLEEQNRWAADLEKLLKDAQARIVHLQEESAAIAAGYVRKVADLEQENREKTGWALDTETRLTADLAARGEQLAATVRLLDAAEATVIERTQWAQRFEADLAQLQARMGMIRESRWLKVGRTVGLGPRFD
jgi:ubiquinone/menaquinone biosynthesis C-methylase UbiE